MHSTSTFGIVENKPNPFLDKVIAFEMGELSREDAKRLPDEAEERGFCELANTLRRDFVDYDQLVA